MAIGLIVESTFEVPKGGVDVPMRAGTEQNKLAAAVQAIWDGLKNQVHTFLVIESADERNYRTELVPQPKTISKGFFVRIFIIDRLD